MSIPLTPSLAPSRAPIAVSWTIYFTLGPVDNPTDGEIELEATSAGEAERWFFTETMLGRSRAPTITAIIRTDCLDDFHDPVFT